MDYIDINISLIVSDSDNGEHNFDLNYTNLQDYFDYPIDNEELIRNIIIIIFYSLIVIVSLVGNTLVCRVVFARKSTTTNLLIGNLAVSDLLMTVLNIPFNIARMILDNWPFGETLCILVPFVQSTSAHCSSITMMVIALERYRRLINSSSINCFTRCMTFSNIVSLIWLLSALFSLPHGVFNQVEDVVFFRKLVRCRVAYPEPKVQFRQRLTLISLLTQYVIPICLTAIVYTRIGVFLWRREIVGTINECRRLSIVKRKRRRIKMLVMVVSVFTTCWLPLNVYLLLSDYQIINYRPTLFFICHWFAMSSVCYNPFIYCWLNDNFRFKAKQLFGCAARQTEQTSGSLPNDTLCDQIRLQPTQELLSGREYQELSNNAKTVSSCVDK